MLHFSINRVGRCRHLVPVAALLGITAPAQITAAEVRDVTVVPTQGRSSSAQVTGAARIAASFGTVTSGFRSIEHNRRVGGVPNSYHLVGRAIDVGRRPGVSHQMIHSALQRAGFVLIESLDERDHSHFAFANAMSFNNDRTGADPGPAMASGKRPVREVLADKHGVLLAAAPVLGDAAGAVFDEESRL